MEHGALGSMQTPQPCCACLPGQTQRLYLLATLLQARAEPSTTGICRRDTCLVASAFE